MNIQFVYYLSIVTKRTGDMEMELESEYTAVLEAAKSLLKAEKDRKKKSDKYRDMDIYQTTATRRASASDRLTNACFALDEAKDWMHKTLVDARLTKAHPIEHYATREITQSAGLGHKINLKYTPPLPNCYAKGAA